VSTKNGFTPLHSLAASQASTRDRFSSFHDAIMARVKNPALSINAFYDPQATVGVLVRAGADLYAKGELREENS